MNFNQLNEMGTWERQKALFIISVAEDMGMDIDGYGEIGVNPNSGYTYVWCEDYNFTLYMPINCELQKTDMYASWFNSDNGDEEDFKLEKGTTLSDIEERTEEMERVNNEN